MVSENLLKEEVKAAIKEAFSERDDICTCEQCYKDVLAITLTKLKPRYAGSDAGEVVLKSVDLSSDQTRLDILRVIYDSIKKVNHNPHHSRQNDE